MQNGFHFLASEAKPLLTRLSCGPGLTNGTLRNATAQRSSIRIAQERLFRWPKKIAFFVLENAHL